MMSILLVHLSDFHFRNADDIVASRGSAIGRAIVSVAETSTSHIVLLFGGDLTFSGKQEQFTIFDTFYKDLTSELAQSNSSRIIHSIFVPGNHDCDLSTDQTARNIVLQNLESSSLAQPSVQQLLITPLLNFFTYTNSLATVRPALTLEHPWYACADISINDINTIRFHLLNTAWMSSIHEFPGSLQYPISQITPPTEGEPEYSVVILHHPLNWLRQPDSMRPMRERIESLADIMFFGHEHVPAIRADGDLRADIIRIEGGTVQSDSQSSFHVLRIDFQSQTTSHSVFTYEADGVYKRSDVLDTPLTINKSRKDLPYELTDNFSKYLNDPGLAVHHPRKRTVYLDDIFIYPDLWAMDAVHAKEGAKQIKSSKVVEELLMHDRVLLTGGEKCGKTAFAKSLFRDLRKLGKVPLLLEGTHLRGKKATGVIDVLKKCIATQYVNLSIDGYLQLDKSMRIVILDDLDEIGSSQQQRNAVINELVEKFGCVVMIADEAFGLEELNGSEGHESAIWEFTHYMILGFGEALRERFVSRWLSIGVDTDTEAADATKELHDTCSLLNHVIRSQLIPTYPMFLIVVVQQMGLGQPLVRGGSYGHLFDAVITAIMSESVFDKLSIKDKYAYLSGFASVLNDNGSARLTDSEMRKWHQEYWNLVGVHIDYESLIDDLVSLGMLQDEMGTISFRYKYNYCFFVAYYLAQNLHRLEIRAKVASLCAKLYHRETADIILFLCHLSNDPLMLEQMKQTADALFSTSPSAAMSEDVKCINTLGQVIPDLILTEDSAEKRRRELLEARDENLAIRDPEVANGSNVSSDNLQSPTSSQEILDIAAATKTIQILGQALMNGAGSIQGDAKRQGVTALFGLARRVLGSFYSHLEQELPGVAEQFARSLREHDPEITNQHLIGQVNSTIYGMAVMVGFVISRMVGTSLSIELLESTRADVVSLDGSVPAKIFDMAADANRPGRLPAEKMIELHQQMAGNGYVQTIVRILAHHHLYQFNVKHNIKQRVCDKLNIKLSKKSLDQGAKRLIENKSAK